MQDNSNNLFFVFVIDPSDAEFLFQYVGRPDIGLKIPKEKLFCDWLISEDQSIRLNSIDNEENLLQETGSLTKAKYIAHQ